VGASINTQLVRNGLVISVDWEHGTRMEYIAPASATHPMTQVGYLAIQYMYLQLNTDLITTYICMCVENYLCRLERNYMTRCN
jgi:hypothetical protein